VPLKQYNTIESLQLIELLNDYKAYNCFNPSIVFVQGIVIIAFRALNASKTKPFHSFLLIYNHINKNKEIIDLSEYYLQHGIHNAADPKLTVLNDQVWVTFNTGYSKKIKNNLYLAPVYPKLGEPYLCHYADRQRVEKNWSFFSEKGVLKALYSIYPLTVIVEGKRDKGTKTIEFTQEFQEVNLPPQSRHRQLTIGSQAVLKNNKLYMMAHEKRYFMNKRCYVGVPICIQKENQNYVRIVSKKRFFHSYLSLLGSLQKHNKNLWSCTYFSGLQIKKDNNVILGYGINDLKYSFKEVNQNKLWE
jgi:hypothetical protein